MKCPKCSYTSFDYLESCKRCGNDLQEVRTLLQIIAVSPEERAPLVGGAAGLAFDAPSPDGFAPTTPVTVPDGFDDEGEEVDFGTRQEVAEDLLSGVNFDDSFDSMMDPTGPTPAPGAAASELAASSPGPALGREEPSDEDLVLELDGLEDFVEASLRDEAPAEEEALDLDGLMEPTSLGSAAPAEEVPLGLDALVEPTSLREAAPAEGEALDLDGLLVPTSLGSTPLADEEPLDLDGLVEPTSLGAAPEPEEEPLKLDELIEPTSLRADSGADAQELEFEEDGMADLLELDFADVFGESKEERQ